MLSSLIFITTGSYYAFGALILLLLIELTRHLVQIKLLSNWLRNLKNEDLPVKNGVWGHIYANIKKIVDEKKISDRRFDRIVKNTKSAANSLPAGLIFLNEKHEIIWANQKAKSFFDISDEDFGKKATYVLRQPEFNQLLISKTKKIESESQLTLRLKNPFNDLILSITVLSYDEKKFIILADDISHLDRLQNSRSEFIANVSHELRTPLTVIHGFIETLQEMKSDDDILRNAITLMSEQTIRMNRLIEDLLNLTQVESQRLRNQEAVDVPSILRSLVKDAQSFPENQHELLIMECSPTWITGNAEELRSAFENLISNAIRYTPGGGTIKIRWYTNYQGVVFSIEDTGVGINQIDIPRLTERFYRVDKSRSRVTGGTGLGLAIVKHIANRHQAEIIIKSKEGIGSIFSLIFPKERCTRPE